MPALNARLLILPGSSFASLSGFRAPLEVVVETTRFEFLSPEWIAMARDEITRALAGKHLRNVRFTLCEEFTDPPDHLRRAGTDRIGFCVRLSGGRVDVVEAPVDDADCTIVSGYADALSVARNPDAAAADPQAMARRVAEGRVRIVGDPSAAPPVLRDLDIHRLLAAHTA